MWKNWIPFRRKEKEDVKRETTRGHDTGKENEEEGKRQFPDDSRSISRVAVSTRGQNSYTADQGFVGKSQRKGSGHLLPSDDNDSAHSSFQHQSLHNGNDEGSKLSRQDPLSSSCKDVVMTRQKRPGPNDSFSAVHGPLLSTPIMPKVRRVIETQSGLRSHNRSALLARGRPIGRSASLNYGSNNPAQSKAGQVPWVRLKRRESVALADIVKGRAPHSPNTIKIAAPEASHLLPAPSFKVTPLIVTPEVNRSRVLDTQTVVSALREKRKRIGGSQHDDSINEDVSWHTTAKRRRQDSSQSNASSVSIPSMPDTLPNLMGNSDASMLHIENVSGQRPSTVPSIDAYVHRHVHDIGLGGEHLPSMQPLHLAKHYPPHGVASKGSMKLTQRALESSLSSSLRARNNLSLLERAGIDLSRIRSNSIGSASRRRTSFSSDVSMLDRSYSVDNSMANSRQVSPSATSEGGENPTTTQPASANWSQNSVSTVSAPTKRKIAEGVMLRKQNLSINSPSIPLQTQKSLQSEGPIGMVDFEQDRNKEYQRRVLDLLTKEEPAPKSSSGDSGVFGKHLSSTSTASPIPVTSSLPNVLPTVSLASSAATSAAISASLDSLNKLVQSTTGSGSSSLALSSSKAPQSKAPISSISQNAPSLSQHSVSSGGSLSTPITISEPNTSSNKSNPTVTSSLLSSMLSKPNVSVVTSVPEANTSTAASNISFGLPTQSLSTSAAGFQINFGSVAASSGSSSSLAPMAGFLTSSAAQQIGFGSANAASALSASNQGQTSLIPTSLMSSSLTMPTITASLNAPTMPPSMTSAMPSAFSAVSTSASLGGAMSGFNFQPISSSGLASSALNTSQSTAAKPGIAFGSQPGGQASSMTAASLPSPGGFNFGSAMTMASTSNPVPSLGAPTVVAFGGLASSPALNQSFANQGASATIQSGPAGVFDTNFAGSVSSNSGLAFGSLAATQSSTQPALSTQANVSSVFSTPSGTTNIKSYVPAANPGLQGPSVFGNVPTSSSSTAVPSAAFNFGGAQTIASQASQLAPAVHASSPFGVPSGQSNPVGGFNFGQAAASSAPSSLFAFGATPSLASTNASGFPSTTVAKTATSGLSFGGMPSSNTNSMSVFSAPSTTSTPPAAFGGSVATFGSATGTAFGSAPASTSAPAFGSTAGSGFNLTSPSVSQPTAFGASTSAGSPFVFGAQPSSDTSKPPAFGTNVSSSVFGSASTAAGGSSVFGSNAPKSNPSGFGSAGVSGVSVFGSQNTSTNPASQPPVFGSQNTSTNPVSQPSVFGSQNTSTNPASQPSVFGSQNTSANTTSPPSYFASNSAAPAFGPGQTTQPTVFGSATKPQSGIFGSGVTSQPTAFGLATTSQSSIFGSGSTQPAAFGSAPASQPSVFGSGQQSPFGSSQTMQPTAFGSGPTTQSTSFGSGSSVFGASSPAAPAFGASTQQPSASVFGASNQNEVTPAFGAANTSGVSVFGAAKPNPFNATAPGAVGAFAFNAAGQLGQNAATSNPFNATVTSSASSGFNFKPPTDQPASPAGGFNFAPQMPQPTFPPQQAGQQAPGGFNFSAASVGSPSFNFSATPTPNNMFSPQTPTTTHRPRAAARRGVRRGTRR